MKKINKNIVDVTKTAIGLRPPAAYREEGGWRRRKTLGEGDVFN